MTLHPEEGPQGRRHLVDVLLGYPDRTIEWILARLKVYRSTETQIDHAFDMGMGARDDWDDSWRRPEGPRIAGAERRQKIRRRGGGRCLIF